MNTKVRVTGYILYILFIQKTERERLGKKS